MTRINAILETTDAIFQQIIQLSEKIFNKKELKKQFLDEVLNIERRLLKQKIPKADVEIVKYVVVAYIDEVVIYSDLEDKSSWLAQPLQLILFNERIAGERFFIYLEELLKRASGETINILELFFVCIQLGFRGKYRQDTAMLEQIQTNIFHKIGGYQERVESSWVLNIPAKKEARWWLEKYSLPLLYLVGGAVVLISYLITTFLIGSYKDKVLAGIAANRNTVAAYLVQKGRKNESVINKSI